MTVAVANTNTSVDTFTSWIGKINEVATALSNVVVSTNSNTAIGNAAVSNSFSANTIYANTFSGGNTTVAAPISISTNATFTANATFNSRRVTLGSGANVAINAGNSTFRVLVVNSAASNTLVATKLTTSDISSFGITSPGNGQILVYASANTTWYNTNAINYNVSTNNVVFSNNVFANNYYYSNGVAFSSLRIYYANGSLAFPS
jgi:hypothetical protein